MAEDNPHMVEHMLRLAENARQDLGDTNRPGQGQRPAGWVEVPSPRLLDTE